MMKQLSFILILGILCAVNIQAQDLYIKFYSGLSVNYGLATVDRITFSSTDLQVHISGSGIQSYGMDSIRYYNGQATMTGIDNTNMLQTPLLKLYPNPTSGSVQLDFSLEETSEIQILLYNLSGQQLFVQIESASAGEQQVILDLKASGIQSGVYILELRSSKKQFINKLIIQ